MRSSRHAPLAVGTLLLLSALTRATQGLNLSDDGFVLTAYSQVFASPGTVSYMFLYYWLINIGGLYNALFGSFGIYGFRVLECVTLAGNMALVWCLLRKAVSGWAVLSGFILIFLMIPWVEVFEYNTFSAFVSLAVIALMMKSLDGSGCKWMFLAGLLSGFNVFVRLPNACMCMLAVVLLPYSYYTGNGRGAWRMLFFCVAGVAAGVSLTLVCMSAAGHLPYFTDALRMAASLAGNEENSHGVGRMLYAAVRNNAFSAFQLLLLAVCPAFSMLLPVKWRDGFRGRLCRAVLLAVHVVALCRLVGRPLLLLNSMAVASCLYVGWVRRGEPRVVFLASLAALMSVLLPLGSDGGILTIGVHGLWLAMPFVPHALSLLSRRLAGSRRRALQWFAALSFAVIAVKAASVMLGPAYYERGTRLDDVCRVENPLANVLTDGKTAAGVDGLLAALRLETGEGDTVLFAGHIPMMHYLTATRPYLHNPWPWVFGHDYFSRQLARSRASCAALPVVACKREDYHAADRRSESLRRFLSGNGYAVAYENDEFMMFVPPGD